MPLNVDALSTGSLTVGGNVIGIDPLKLPFKKGSVGPKVSFVKSDYADPTTTKDVIIPGVLEITRGVNGGIYNIAVENSFNSNVSPLNTEWNTQFVNPDNTDWSNLWNIENRTYDTWKGAVDTPEGQNAPPLYVGMCSIMHETTTDRYWLIKFTKWTVGGQGGGFAYDRYEIYPSVTFERPNYNEFKLDKISDGVHIARSSNGNALFNAVTENKSNVGVSPENTRWNSEYTDSRPNYSGFNDLSNLEKRVYTDFALALDYSVGNNVLSTDLIMHDLTTDLYYKVTFSSWTQSGNGGGFEYTRQVIPQSSSIVFADGSTLNTASGGGGSSSTFPYVDAQGNTIIADSSNNTDTVAPGDSHLIADFSGMLLVNDHFSGRVELWIAGGGTTQLVSNTEGVSSSTLTQNGNGYEWTNVDNLNGPFTFTVVKTRDTA